MEEPYIFKINKTYVLNINCYNDKTALLCYCSRLCSILGKFAVTFSPSRYVHQKRAIKSGWQ